MIRKTRIPALACTCEICGYDWYSIARKIPESCPNRVCRSREWNGKKVRETKPKIKMPKPRKVRIIDDEF